MRHRIAVGILVCTLVATACGGRVDHRSSSPAPGGTLLGQVAASPREHVPSALRHRGAAGLPRPLVDLNVLTSGGPPPDGIPAIEQPRFLAAQDVRFLADTERVLALEVGNDARAYPVQIMTWHEIVDDTVVVYRSRCRTARSATARSPTTDAPSTVCSTSASRGCSTTRHSSCSTGRSNHCGATSPDKQWPECSRARR